MAAGLILSSMLLLASVNAQSQSNSSSYLDVTFSSSDARDCGQGTTGYGNAITISITSPPVTSTCFNLNETFANPNRTYSTGSYRCTGGTACGANYTLSGAEHLSVTANYSQIWYRQSAPSGNGDGDSDEKVGRLIFQTYNGLDCLQVGDATGKLEPWIGWNCNESNGECSTNPYDVQSFSVGPVGNDKEGSKGCVVRADYASDSAKSRAAGSAIAMVFAVACAAFFA